MRVYRTMLRSMSPHALSRADPAYPQVSTLRFKSARPGAAVQGGGVVGAENPAGWRQGSRCISGASNHFPSPGKCLVDMAAVGGPTMAFG